MTTTLPTSDPGRRSVTANVTTRNGSGTSSISNTAPSELDDDALHSEMESCLSKSKQLDVQLGQPRRFYPDGTMYTLSEYHQWRQQAKLSKEMLTTRYRALRHESQQRQPSDPHSEVVQFFERVDAKLERTNELLERLVALIEQDE